MAETKKGYPYVTARVSREEDRMATGNASAFLQGMTVISSKFPYEYYNIIDNLAMIDPYISKFVYSTIALGNNGHNIEINASTEAQADKVIAIANDLAARCYPYAGGMDGLVNSLLSQMARAGGLCIEWVPDIGLKQIDRAYVLPIKTIRFRYDDKGLIELCQSQIRVGDRWK